MDLDRIRKMSDDELKKYLLSLSSKKGSSCVKCGKDNSNYTILVQNKSAFQQKKLCNMCEECYQQLLKENKISDIIWQ